MFKRILLNIVPLLVLASGCQCGSDIDLDEQKVETHFKRFDQAFFGLDTANFDTSLAQLKEEYPMFFMNQGTNKFWYTQRTDKQQQSFARKASQVFGDMAQENQQLNQALKRYYHYFGLKDTLRFYTYVSRLDYDYPVIYADSLLFLAIDLYLGQDYKPYQYLPRYLAFEKQPQFLVRDAVEALIPPQLPPPNDPQTLLDAMIYHGKKIYVLEQLLPALNEAVLLKYPQEKLNYAREHEKEMWVYFIENKLLYDTSTETQRRFIELAPFSKFRTQSDPKTPGRIGQWYGYKIVKGFMEKNEEYRLKDMLKESDSQKILRGSGYKPG